MVKRQKTENAIRAREWCSLRAQKLIDIRDKVVSNMQEVRARGGTIVAVTTDDDTAAYKHAEYTVRVPSTPYAFLSALLSIIPMQLLAYHVARLNGCDIDQPRNLAKSVTVE